MDRISSYGSHSHSLAKLMESQVRMADLQTQVSTGKRSQNYTGIAKSSNRLINMEVEWSTAKSFIDRNTIVGVQLSAMEQGVKAADKTVRDFLNRLVNFSTDNLTDEHAVSLIQQNAMQAMLDLEATLNVNVDGQYLFSGAKVMAEPVELGSATLAQFQTNYDGMNIDFPATRAAHLQDISLPPTVAGTGGVYFGTDGTMKSVTAGAFAGVAEGSRITLSGAAGLNAGKTFTVVEKIDNSTLRLSRLTDETVPPTTATFTFKDAAADGSDVVINSTLTANVVFEATGDTITTLVPGEFNGLPAGTIFTVAGTSSNDGQYQIKTNDGTTITIESVKVATEGTLALPIAYTVSSASWYQGDSFMQERRVDTDRMIETGILATDTVFEKAFRAMGLIAQGQFGTAGGLDNNLSRIDEAIYLLRDVLNSPAYTATPPAIPELKGDLESLEAKIAWNQTIIGQKKEKHTLFTAFLETRIADIENVDRTEASTLLLNETNVLQASYATIAKVRQLSLLDYLG